MELLYCCLPRGDATCGRWWLFDANFKQEAARWARTGYMLIVLLKFSFEFRKISYYKTVFTWFSSKTKPQVRFTESVLSPIFYQRWI